MRTARTTEGIASALPGSADTIAAIATAQGRGALALIRMSGPDAFVIGKAVMTTWPEAARRPTLCTIVDSRSGAVLDRALVTRFEAPQTFTGEDLVEVTSHGGLLVPHTILAALIAQGARQATAGEFTRRAVLNGKLDIVQAEAISDLIDARSRRAQHVALAQLDGGLSRRIEALRSSLIEIEALIAYDIDFPEEDDGPVPPARVLAATDAALSDLTTLRATASTGELVRDGAVVVLAGAPNVGKSSLFNALLGQSRAIVTDIPGTTRDALEAVVDAGGWALRLVDTAGLRGTMDRVEQLGIEMSERYLDQAAVVLACGDSIATVDAVLDRVTRRTTASVIVVHTKADVNTGERPQLVSRWYQYPGAETPIPAVAVSAERGKGLDLLVDVIQSVLQSDHGDVSLDAPVLTRARHTHAIDTAIEEVGQFREAWAMGALPAPVSATHLRQGVLALEELIGVVDVDDVLDRVFSAFCVGK
jgi:tRNA modification GTPase